MDNLFYYFNFVHASAFLLFYDVFFKKTTAANCATTEGALSSLSSPAVGEYFLRG